MKEKFEAMEFDVVRFETEDVIRTSPDLTEDGDEDYTILNLESNIQSTAYR